MPALSSADTTAEVEQALGHRFKDRSLLAEALTHRTYAHEHPEEGGTYNERLEFLGDAVLELAVSEFLFETLPGEDEGTLSRRRSGVVQEAALAAWARSINLGPALRLGKGEDRTGGREKPSILSDAMEAVIAAVYLDAGWETARDVVRRGLESSLCAGEDALIRDFKSELQEQTQARLGTTPVYRLIEESGPDHERTFTVDVLIGETAGGRGTGRSKKEAEQNAAKNALSSDTFGDA